MRKAFSPATAIRARPKSLSDVVLLFGISLALGLLYLGGASLVSALVMAPLLSGAFFVYNSSLSRNHNLKRGLLLGLLVGLLLGSGGLLLGGAIVDVRSGLLWGAALGFALGALVGLVSRVAHNEYDTVLARLFLFFGSIWLGAGLGAGVGLMTGLILGAIAQSWAGTFLALVAGGIVGGYLGSYYHQLRWTLVGVTVAVVVTAVSILLGGAFSGLILGAIAGSFAPISLVAFIGAAGGLLARGPRAMVVEALEAPTEMLEQGAAPYLLPAVITGAVVGTTTAGPDGLILLTAVFGLMGVLFGVITEINGRPGSLVTIRSLVEMAMIGGDWPMERILRLLTGRDGRDILRSALLGALLGLLGALLGWLLATQLVKLVV
jgi:hypothetical protein